MGQKKKKHKKKNRFVSFFLTLGIVVCIGVIGFSGYKLVTTWLEYREGDEEYAELRNYTEEVNGGSEEQENEPGQEPGPETGSSLEAGADFSSEREEIDLDDMRTNRKPPINVDWKSLKEINEDIVGWLYIGALDVSYPVVHGEDDDYYLHRTFERTDNFAGSIFVEADNAGDFRDPNTIVYGHNMLNGSMFGSLSNLTSGQEPKYKENHWFWIMTPNGNYRYRMFSIHVTGVTSDVYTLFTGTDDKYLEWCHEMAEASSVELEEEEFTLHSKIVTLSTCTGDPGTRYVVQGIAIKN